MQKHVILQQYFISRPSALPKVMHIAMCCLVASMNPSFLSPPKQLRNSLWKAKRSWGFVWLLLGWGFFVVVVTTTFSIGGLLKNPNYYTADSHHLVFQNISQIQRSKGFQKTKKKFSQCSYSQLCFLQRTPINRDAQRAKVLNEPGGAGCSEGAAATWLWKTTRSILLQRTEQRTYSICGFSGAPSPQQTTCAHASPPFKLFRSVDFH